MVLGADSIQCDLGVLETANSIRQKRAELIGGDDEQAEVNPAFHQRVADMADVNNHQVASSGNLNFDPKADPSSIDSETLRPIDLSATPLLPAARCAKLFIDQFPNGSAAIPVNLFFDEQIECAKNLLDFRP